MSTHSARPVPDNSPELDYRFLGRVLIKAALLFLVFNLAYVLLDPLSLLGRVSLYNHPLPGRLRLPYSDDPAHSFNMSIPQLEAMFSSHILDAAAKAPDEFRVLLIGDSSIWGFLLAPGETLAARLSALDIMSSDGRKVVAYNLGYPTMSVTKDLLILENGLAYQPDLILWFITLESLPWVQQLQSPLLELNPQATTDLIQRTDLSLVTEPAQGDAVDWWGKCLLGQRRALADWVRFQLYGFVWAATSVDHVIPETYNQRMEDLPAELEFQSIETGNLRMVDLAFEVLEAGAVSAGDVPLIFINEPIFISHGENSDIRYNFYYPRWAYDQYRALLVEAADEKGWQVLDLWDAVPEAEFTDSAIHYTPNGVEILSNIIAARLGNP